MLNEVKKKYPHFLLSGLVTLGVLYFTLMPRPLGGLRVPLFVGADKVIHFIMLGWIFVLSTVFGGLIELAQSGMNMGRSGDWFDLIADAGGALYGCVVAWLLIKK